MSYITTDNLGSFANKFAAKIATLFAKKTDIPVIPENAKFTDTTYSDMTGATASKAGTAGLVPSPGAGKQGAFLRGDGKWENPANTTYSVATSSLDGLMSKSDKTKLDGIEAATDAEIDAIVNGTFTS